MRLIVICVLASLATACSPQPGDVVSQTAAHIADIRSGTMKLEATIDTAEGDTATGFTIQGPFSLPDEAGALPEADLTYVQMVDTSEAEGRFIATGESLFTEVDGQAYELPADQVDSFRTEGSQDAGSLFTGVDLSDWIPAPVVEESGDTKTVTGELDVVAALNDISEIAARFGGAPLAHLEGDDAEVVRNAVESSSVEISSGAEDDLLRQLTIEIDFRVADEKLAETLGPFAGATFSLDLLIENPNEPVDIEAPEGALPYEELGVGA